jgi:hypothetical protein
MSGLIGARMNTRLQHLKIAYGATVAPELAYLAFVAVPLITAPLVTVAGVQSKRFFAQSPGGA